jgi:MFS family permease
VGAAGTFWSDLRIVLRERDFRRLFVTRLTSQTGDGAFQVGLAGLFFFSPERATTAAGIAAAFTVAVLPYTLVGPFAGVLLDRWRRRQVLLVANLVRAGLAVLVAAVAHGDSARFGGAAVPLLYLLVLTSLSVNRFLLAGLGASLPRVVPTDHVDGRSYLVMANSVAPTSGTVAAFLGVALGSLLRLRSGAGAGAGTDALVVLTAGGLHLAAALLATRMPPDLLGPDPRPATGTTTGPATPTTAGAALGAAVRNLGTGLVAGAVHVRHRRRAWHALAAIGGHRFAYGITTLLTVLLCRYHLTTDVDAGLGVLAAILLASGTGVVVAALVTPLATRRMPAESWIVLCLVAACAVQFWFVLSLTVPVAVAGGLVLGLAAQGTKICVDAVVQTEVDDGFRGRVMSLYDVVFNAAFVAAAAVTALSVHLGVLPEDGYSPPAFALVGVVYAACAVGLRRVTRGSRMGTPSGWTRPGGMDGATPGGSSGRDALRTPPCAPGPGPVPMPQQEPMSSSGRGRDCGGRRPPSAAGG